MTEVGVALALYWAWGVVLAARMGWTDGEYSTLPAGLARSRAHYESQFVVTDTRVVRGVLRLPFRMPGAYWLYGWAGWVRPAWQRPMGRGFSLGLSVAGVTVLLLWARELAGPAGVAWAAAVLVASATLVGSYATASYEGAIAAGWMLGLYAVWHDAPLAAVACGIALALLRASALPQSCLLWALAGSWWGILAAGAVFGYLWGWQREVLMANGWVLLLRREEGAPFVPRDGWAYGLRVVAQRYEPWLLILPMTGVGLGVGVPRPVWALLGVTLLALVAAHGPRAWIRPKWVVGYLPDFALPVVLVAGVALAQLGKWAWVVGGVAVLWGLWRPRHPAIPTEGKIIWKHGRPHDQRTAWDHE